MSDELPTDLVLTDASGVPYYRQIEDRIAAWIRSGRLPAGAPLPSVRKLATRLAVSVITTRRAYADLEAAGLVERQRGRGTFVAPSAGVETFAQDRARQLLGKALDQAAELGLTPDELRRLVLELLSTRSPS